MKVTSSDMQQAMVTQRVTNIPNDPLPTWDSIQFNASGNQMLVQAGELSMVLDGYEGTIQRIFQSSPQSKGGTVSCFTPDDQFVVMGTQAGGLDCWNVQSGTIVKSMEGHAGPVGALACNPKFAQIASSCSSTCLWIW
jgi:WD40 repeat protein